MGVNDARRPFEVLRNCGVRSLSCYSENWYLIAVQPAERVPDHCVPIEAGAANFPCLMQRNAAQKFKYVPERHQAINTKRLDRQYCKDVKAK